MNRNSFKIELETLYYRRDGKVCGPFEKMPDSENFFDKKYCEIYTPNGKHVSISDNSINPLDEDEDLIEVVLERDSEYRDSYEEEEEELCDCDVCKTKRELESRNISMFELIQKMVKVLEVNDVQVNGGPLSKPIDNFKVNLQVLAKLFVMYTSETKRGNISDPLVQEDFDLIFEIFTKSGVLGPYMQEVVGTFITKDRVNTEERETPGIFGGMRPMFITEMSLRDMPDFLQKIISGQTGNSATPRRRNPMDWDEETEDECFFFGDKIRYAMRKMEYTRKLTFRFENPQWDMEDLETLKGWYDDMVKEYNQHTGDTEKLVILK